MNGKKIVKRIAVLSIAMIAIRCTTTSGDKSEINWLSAINNTSWEHSAETLKFNSSGKQVLKNDGIQYYFCYAESSRVGVYFTDIKFPPTKWYAFYLTNELIQYGPFLSTNDIIKNTNTSTVFTKAQ